MFKEYLVPVIKASKVLNRFTCKLFLDSMWSNLMERGVTFAGIELGFTKKDYCLKQVTYMLSKEYADAFCKGWGYPEPIKGDEYWISHKPGIFSKYFKWFTFDKSTKGFTKEDVEEFVNLSNVSQKVKNQTLAFCNEVLDTEGHILALNTPLNVPFADKMRVYCIPARPEGKYFVDPDEIIEFATCLGFSQDLTKIEGMEGYDLECRYISVTIGKHGVERDFGVEITSKSKLGFSSALDYLKSVGLAEDSHIPSSSKLKGFHHIKLTFKNGKVTPKLYVSIGYSKYNDPKPQKKPTSRNS